MNRPTADILPFGPVDYPQGPRIIRPMSPADIARAMGEPREVVDLYDSLAANDREYRERERKAWGGRFGLASVFLICVLIGLMLATGGVL